MRKSKSKIEGHGERISSISCEGIDWMLLVEMSVVTTISFLAHLVPALRMYIYICADGARGRTLAHVQATWARPTMRARTELFIPAGDSVSLVLSPFLLRSGRARTPPTLVPFPHPRPLPPPLGFSLSFLSFLLFSLLLPIFSSRLQSSQEEIRPLGSRNILENIFDFSHSPGISPRRNFYSSSSPFFFRFLSFSRRNSPRRGRNAFLARFRARITDFREAAYLEFLPRI